MFICHLIAGFRINIIFNEIWVSSEQESPKSRAGGLVAGHQSLICGELHHPSGLQGKRFVRCRIGFTCCEFRPRRGNALGIWKRVESLLHKQWNPEQLRAGSRVRRDGVSVVNGWAVLLIWTSAGAVPPEQVQQHGQAQPPSHAHCLSEYFQKLVVS